MKNDIYNRSKLAFHEEKLKSLKEGKITSPIYVRIKPTNKCNHACYYCSYVPENECTVSENMNFNDEISKEKMLEILNDFKEMGVKAITFSGGGEPLIYPYIEEIMQKTLDYGIELSIITNGQELNGNKARILSKSEWVRISAGEIDAENFVNTRKRPASFFYKLQDNIKNFSKIKKNDCELGINFVVQKNNADKVYESAKYFKNLGVNHIKFTACWVPEEFFEYHKPIKEDVIEQIKKARKDFEDENFKIYDTYEEDFLLTGLCERKYEKCYIMQIIPVIGADSVVYFCHDKTYSKSGVLGSIRKKSFKELWFSEETKEIFENFNPKKKCKHHCTYDSRNLSIIKMIENLENIDKFKPDTEKHKNFI
ncbi:MAG: radical SAM protein [Candidatus Pacearchaeota archaeon]